MWPVASSESLTRCPVTIGSRESLRGLAVNGADAEIVVLAGWGKLVMVMRGAGAFRSRSRVFRVPLTTEGSVETDTDVTVNKGGATPCPEAGREALGRDSAGTTSGLFKAALLREGDDLGFNVVSAPSYVLQHTCMHTFINAHTCTTNHWDD